MHRALAIVLAFLCLTATDASALSMNLQADEREGLVYVNLWGSIEQGDGERFRQLITPHLRAGYVLYEVNVFSTGGLIAPAIDIGKQVRQLGARTRGPILRTRGNPECWFAEKTGDGVRHRAVSGYGWCTCASACVMIWIGGLTRDGNVIGLHRVSLVNNGLARLSPPEAQSAYAGAQERMLSYYRSMGLPTSLGDRMMATRAGEIYYAQDPELDLMRSTPFVEEYAVQLCGSYPSRPVGPGSQTYPIDGADNSCFLKLLKTLMRQGVQSYLSDGISPR